MEAVLHSMLQYPTTDMAMDHRLRLRAVPCKKRPLSWYKPPTSPRDQGRSVSPVNLGHSDSPVNLSHLVNPINLGHSVSPVNLGHSVSPVNLGCSVSPVNLGHSVSPVNLGCSVSPVNLGHSVSPINLGHPVSPINMGHSVSPVNKSRSASPGAQIDNLGHSVNSVNLDYSVCSISPSHSVSPITICHPLSSPANGPESPVNLASSRNTVSPASPTSSTSSHEDVMQPPLGWPGAPLLGAYSLASTMVSTSTLSAPRPPAVRRQSDFSIEHILRDAGTPRSTTASSHPEGQPEGHFEWLQCTRYRPPKLPRSRRRDGPAQRRLGRNPRIPFSPQQVAVLEARFSRSHYLSSADVAELSAQLELSETRVKIWFQNRRARERRDGDGKSTNSSPHNSGLTSQMAKPPAPSHLPRSTISAFSVPKSQLTQNDEPSNFFSTEGFKSN